MEQSSHAITLHWRRHVAAGGLIVAGLVSLGTLFFPWTLYSWTQYASGNRSACYTCGLNQNVPFDDFMNAQANGASFSSLALAVLVYAGIPFAFVLVGLIHLLSRQPVRLWERVLVILSAVFFLGAVFLLEFGFGLQHFGDPGVTGNTGAAEWVALVAPVTVVLAGALLPGRGILGRLGNIRHGSPSGSS